MSEEIKLKRSRTIFMVLMIVFAAISFAVKGSSEEGIQFYVERSARDSRHLHFARISHGNQLVASWKTASHSEDKRRSGLRQYDACARKEKRLIRVHSRFIFY